MAIHRSERIIECAVNAVQKIVDVSYIRGKIPLSEAKRSDIRNFRDGRLNGRL